MAVLDSVPGLAVSVLVDGNALQEYPDDEEAARLASLPEGIKTVPVFVEAVSEKEFVVRLSVDESFRLSSPVLIFDVIVDGNVAYRPIISSLYVAGSGLYKAMTKCSRHIEGVYFAIPGDLLRESLKKFKFSNIVSTDDAARDFQEDASHMKEAGEIVVHAFRAGNMVRHVQETMIPSGETLNKHNTDVHEKALKGEAKSHITSFGAHAQTHQKSYYRVDYLDGYDHPFATYRFKYRSSEALKSLLVIRTASPEAEIAPESLPSRSPTPDLDNLSAEDRERILQLLRANPRRDNARIKQEGSNDAANRTHPSKTVKREHSEDRIVDPAAKRSKIGDVAFVDLCGSSDEENS